MHCVVLGVQEHPTDFIGVLRFCIFRHLPYLVLIQILVQQRSSALENDNIRLRNSSYDPGSLIGHNIDMAEDSGRSVMINSPQNLLLEHIPLSTMLFLRIFTDLFNFEHGVNAYLPSLQQIEVLARLTEIVDHLALFYLLHGQLVFERLGPAELEEGKPFDLGDCVQLPLVFFFSEA